MTNGLRNHPGRFKGGRKAALVWLVIVVVLMSLGAAGQMWMEGR